MNPAVAAFLDAIKAMPPGECFAAINELDQQIAPIREVARTESASRMREMRTTEPGTTTMKKEGP